MKKATHIEKQRQEIKHTRDTVMTITGISEQDYFEFQHLTGLKYLDALLANEPTAYEEISSSKIFWNWWKLMWMYREDGFCNYDMLSIHSGFRINIWRQFHNPLMLANGKSLEGTMMENSFATVIGIIIKEKTQRK